MLSSEHVLWAEQCAPLAGDELFATSPAPSLQDRMKSSLQENDFVLQLAQIFIAVSLLRCLSLSSSLACNECRLRILQQHLLALQFLLSQESVWVSE